MSILFFDKLVFLDKLDHQIKKRYLTNEERQEIWQMVEEIIHHRVIGCCLHHLPKNYHNEFLDIFHKSPHDENILKFLSSKTKKDMKKVIKDEIKTLTKELLLLNSNKV